MAAEEQAAFILGIGILAVAALLFSTLFARLGLSIVPAQIIAGMVVGPFFLGFVTNTTILDEISSIGIVLLLFIIGLELDPVELTRIAGKVTLYTLLEVGIVFVFGLFASLVLSLSLLQSIIFSTAFSFTSTAIVSKAILDRRALQSTGARYLMGLLIVEDIIAIGFLVFLSSISSSEQGILSLLSPAVNSTSISVAGITGIGIAAALEALLGGLALIGLAYFVARYVAPTIINYLSTFEDEYGEISFLFALGLGFLFAVLAVYLGYSPGIGAFIIGLSIRGKQSKFLAQKIAPIKDLFLVLFFVSMGALINPIPSLDLGLLIAVVFVLVIMGKFVGGYLVAKIFSSRRISHAASSSEQRDTLFSNPLTLGSRLVPRGEFSFVIGQLSLTLGLIDDRFFSLIGMAVLVTAVVASILQKLVEPKRAAAIHPFRGRQDD